MGIKQIRELPAASSYTEEQTIFAIQQGATTRHISGSQLGYASDAQLVAASASLLAYTDASVVAASANLTNYIDVSVESASASLVSIISTKADTTLVASVSGNLYSLIASSSGAGGDITRAEVAVISAGLAAVDATKADITLVASISAGLDTRVDKIEAIHDDTMEPTGFVNRTSSTLAFSDLTKTFTIAGTYEVYCDGVKFTKTGETQVINNTHGMHFFYYDTDGSFVYSDGVAWSILAGHCMIAAVYWDAASQKGILIEERHGCQMDAASHYYNHSIYGTQRLTAGAIGNYTITTDTDLAMKFTCGKTNLADEDINYETVSAVASGDYKFVYRQGATTWIVSGANTLPYLVGTNIRYNQKVGNDFQQTDLSTNDTFVNYYLVSTLAVSGQYSNVLVPGQTVYTSLALAQGEAFNNLELTNFPFIEFNAVYQLTFRYRNTYGSTGKARLEANPVLLGLRSATSAVAPATTHNALAGLQGGAAGEYFHLTSTQNADFIGRTEVATISAGLQTLTSAASANAYNQAVAYTNNAVANISGAVTITGTQTISGEKTFIDRIKLQSAPGTAGTEIEFYDGDYQGRIYAWNGFMYVQSVSAQTSIELNDTYGQLNGTWTLDGADPIVGLSTLNTNSAAASANAYNKAIAFTAATSGATLGKANAYTDAAIGGVSSNSVLLTGDQSISGSKTFYTHPINSPAGPFTNSQRFGLLAGENCIGTYCTYVGYAAGRQNGAGTHNTAIGSYAGVQTSGNGNVFIGSEAGELAAVGSNHNVVIGDYAGQSMSGSSNIFIGNLAGVDAKMNNSLIIHSSDTDVYSPWTTAGLLLYGRFNDSDLWIKGNKIWHAGNDGTGSGLDADTVDGFHTAAITAASKVYTDAAIAAVGSGDMLADLVSSVVNISANTTLDSTAYGKMHVITAPNAGLQVILPATTDKNMIGLKIADTSQGLVTISGSNIDGSALRYMWKNESAILMSDATSFKKVGGETIPMAISVCMTGTYAANKYALNSGAYTLIRHNHVQEQPFGNVVDMSGYYVTVPRPAHFVMSITVNTDDSGAMNIFPLLNSTNVDTLATRYMGGQLYSAVRNLSLSAQTPKALAKGDVLRIYCFVGDASNIDPGYGPSWNSISYKEIPLW